MGHGHAERFGLRRDLGGGIEVADATEPVGATMGNDVGLAAFRARMRAAIRSSTAARSSLTLMISWVAP